MKKLSLHLPPGAMVCSPASLPACVMLNALVSDAIGSKHTKDPSLRRINHRNGKLRTEPHGDALLFPFHRPIAARQPRKNVVQHMPCERIRISETPSASARLWARADLTTRRSRAPPDALSSRREANRSIENTDGIPATKASAHWKDSRPSSRLRATHHAAGASSQSHARTETEPSSPAPAKAPAAT